MTSLSILLHPEFDHQQLIRIARRVEDLGFDGFWYPDERFYRDTYVGLAACAMATRNMRLGPAVTDPYTRHPSLTAVAMASLAELSSGRAVLGIGAGISGFAQLGLRPARAAVALREAIDLIRRLWAGERVTADGEFVRARSLALNMPVAFVPPIVMAADGPATTTLAGEIADGVILMHCASAEILASKLKHVQRGRARRSLGSSLRIIARLDVSVSPDQEAAMAVVKLRVGRYLWARYPTLDYLDLHGLALPAELERRLAAQPFVRTHDLQRFAFLAEVIPDELVRPLALAGTAEQVRRQMDDVFAAGADEVMLYPVTPAGMQAEELIELLGSLRSPVALTQ